MDDTVRRSMEDAFGTDFSGVRIHDDARAGELSTRIQASAFTVGSDIFFRNGAPDTSTTDGQHLLAHELAHTVQQTGAAQRTVRRRYLDMEKDWVGDTQYKGKFGIGTAPRSKYLKEIDRAVEAWHQAYALGSAHQLELAAQNILAKITAWETGKGKSTDDSMRSGDFSVLRNEATTWLADLQAWKAAHAGIAAKHDQDRQTLRNWVAEGRAQDADTRLRNACEWVDTGRTRLYVVNEAPAPKVRGAMLQNKFISDLPDDTIAYFPDPFAGPAGSLHAAPALYDKDNLASDHNISLDEEGRGTKGWNVAGDHIVITEEGIADGRGHAWGTLKHEVQHDADKHQKSEQAQGVTDEKARLDAAENQEQTLLQNWEQAYAALEADDTPVNDAANDAAAQAYNTFTADTEYTERKERLTSAKALQEYKTEYRAHFYQGDARFDSEPHDPNNRISRWGFQWTRRQWSVFAKIHRNYPTIKAAWGDIDPSVASTPIQTAFRTAINGYWNPDTEGFNKYDSVRVDDLYNALDAVPPGTTDATHAEVVKVLAAAKKLEESDLRYLVDRQQAVMFNTKIDRHLDGAARAALRDYMTAEVEDFDTGEAIAGLFS